MTYKIICRACGEVIPEGQKFIRHDGLCFCNEDCVYEYEVGTD